MSMPVTGLIILSYLLICLFFRPRNLAPAVMFFAPFTGTAIINFDFVPLGVSPSYVSMVMLVLSGLLFGSTWHRYRVSRDHLIQLSAMIIFGLTSFFSAIRNFTIHDPAPNLLTQTAYIIFGVLTTTVLSFEFTRPDQFDRALRAIRLSSLFVCFWATVQLVCFYAHIPYPAVVFNTSVSKSADMFAQSLGAIVRLASVAVEPSVMVFSLLHFLAFGLSVVVLDPKLRIKAWVIPTSVTLLLILGSTSSTGYVGLILIALLLGLRRPMVVLAGAAPFLFIGGLTLFIFPQFAQTIWDVTFNKTDSYSYMERMEAVQGAFEFFFQSPIFGAGWGAVTPGDLFGTILGNSGIIGLVSFIVAIGAMMISLQSVAKTASVRGDTKINVYAIGAQNAIIVSLGCSMTSGMKYYFLDDWCYWAIAIALSSQRITRSMAEAIKVTTYPLTRSLRGILPEVGVNQANNLEHVPGRGRHYAK